MILFYFDNACNDLDEIRDAFEAVVMQILLIHPDITSSPF